MMYVTKFCFVTISIKQWVYCKIVNPIFSFFLKKCETRSISITEGSINWLC